MFDTREFIIGERIENIMKTYTDKNDYNVNEMYDKIHFCLIERDFTRDINYQKKIRPVPGTYGTMGPATEYVYDLYYAIKNFEQIIDISDLIFVTLDHSIKIYEKIKFVDRCIVFRFPSYNKEMDETLFQKYVRHGENYINDINNWLDHSNRILRQEIIDRLESLRTHDHYDNEDYDYYYDENNAGRSPNDQRSDVYNPNNPDYKAAMDNRSNQLNPNNPAHARRR